MVVEHFHRLEHHMDLHGGPPPVAVNHVPEFHAEQMEEPVPPSPPPFGPGVPVGIIPEPVPPSPPPFGHAVHGARIIQPAPPSPRAVGPEVQDGLIIEHAPPSPPEFADDLLGKKEKDI